MKFPVKIQFPHKKLSITTLSRQSFRKLTMMTQNYIIKKKYIQMKPRQQSQILNNQEGNKPCSRHVILRLTLPNILHCILSAPMFKSPKCLSPCLCCFLYNSKLKHTYTVNMLSTKHMQHPFSKNSKILENDKGQWCNYKWLHTQSSCSRIRRKQYLIGEWPLFPRRALGRIEQYGDHIYGYHRSPAQQQSTKTQMSHLPMSSIALSVPTISFMVLSYGESSMNTVSYLTSQNSDIVSASQIANCTCQFSLHSFLFLTAFL